MSVKSIGKALRSEKLPTEKHGAVNRQDSSHENEPMMSARAVPADASDKNSAKPIIDPALALPDIDTPSPDKRRRYGRLLTSRRGGNGTPAGRRKAYASWHAGATAILRNPRPGTRAAPVRDKRVRTTCRSFDLEERHLRHGVGAGGEAERLRAGSQSGGLQIEDVARARRVIPEIEIRIRVAGIVEHPRRVGAQLDRPSNPLALQRQARPG